MSKGACTVADSLRVRRLTEALEIDLQELRTQYDEWDFEDPEAYAASEK
jgi:hypothetical protein